MLTHASQRTNTKLRDVAAQLVQTGTLPSRVKPTRVQRSNSLRLSYVANPAE
jgi:hypothetical protein